MYNKNTKFKQNRKKPLTKKLSTNLKKKSILRKQPFWLADFLQKRTSLLSIKRYQIWPDWKEKERKKKHGRRSQEFEKELLKETDTTKSDKKLDPDIGDTKNGVFKRIKHCSRLFEVKSISPT